MQLFVAAPPQRYRAAAFFNNNTRQVRGDEPPRVCVHAYDRARAFWRPSVWGFSRFSLLSNVTSVWWERPRETGGQSGDVPGKSHESSCWPRLLRSYHANGVSQSFERKPFLFQRIKTRGSGSAPSQGGHRSAQERQIIV